MRLQLIAAAALGVIAAMTVTARAEPDALRAAGHVSAYVDDDDIVVVSPGAGVHRGLSDKISGELEVSADTVTGASVDVVTSASSRAIREQREELALGVIAKLPGYVTASARLIGSHEHDYDVVDGWALVDAELAARNLDVELGWNHREAWVGDFSDPAFAERRRDDRATLRLTQVIDRRTYADLLVDLARTDGYQASPYRRIALDDPRSPIVTFVDEATPRLRHAVAAALRLRRAIGARWAAHAGYRFAIDDWGVRSHTGDGLAAVELAGDRWRLGVSARGYVQSAADFWRARYENVDGTTPRWRTRDRTLGRMRSLSAQLVVDRALRDDARVQLSVGATRYAWPDDPLQRARLAITSTISISVDE